MAVKTNYGFIILIILYILNILVVKTAAYQALIPAAEDGTCSYRGDKLEVGTQSGPAPCQSLTCNKDGTILVEGCGKIWLQNCNRGERLNLEKPYPECCKITYKCKNPDGSSYYIEKDTANGQTKTENST